MLPADVRLTTPFEVLELMLTFECEVSMWASAREPLSLREKIPMAPVETRRLGSSEEEARSQVSRKRKKSHDTDRQRRKRVWELRKYQQPAN